MADIQKSHALPSGKRVETGVIQFGDDWPGVFFRGDEARATARMLKALMQHVGHPEYLANGSLLHQLVDQLESCRVKNKELS